MNGGLLDAFGDGLTIDFEENVLGTGTFEMSPEGGMSQVYPEDDLMPGTSSDQFAANLAEDLDETYLTKLSSELIELIEDDITSRDPWTERFRTGMEMLGLIPDEFDDGPFPGSSTATMPIINEATVQFWARAMAEQAPPDGPVKVKAMGRNPTGELLDRADRVSDYMNHDLMQIDRSWYADHSRMLFSLPKTGSAFKKVYYDQEMGRVTSVYVHVEDFITNYQFTSLEDAPRYTHRIWRTKNELRKAVVAGVYREAPVQEAPQEDLPDETEIKIEAMDWDSADQGRNDNRYEIYECYCELDIPGHEDLDENGRSTGVALPYIVTIERESEKVLAIYRGWKEADPLKRRRIYFKKYDYLPGDGFYGYGLFHLIGGLQQAATGALRAIIDGAATASLQGGLMSKDASMKAEDLIIEPGVYKQVDATSEDLGKAFFTPPFKEPSPVLFQIMGFITQRAEKFAATTEMQTGTENAKNMPVGSTAAMIEQGSKVFSTVHKTLHKSLGEELRLRYDLLAEYIPVEGYPYDVGGDNQALFAQDFAPGLQIVPVSDPNIFSNAQRVAINQAVYDLAQQNPDVLDRPVVIRRVLTGLNVPDIDELFIDQGPPEPMGPAEEIQALLRGDPVQAYPDQDHMSHVQHYMSFLNNPQFGGNPQIQEQIGPQALALLGQRLAYLWGTHARSLQVPVGLLPPPMGGEGVPPQLPPEQLAQMLAQIAPQMAQVPGMPSPEAQAETAKLEAETAKLQIEQAKGEMDIQAKQMDLQFKGQEMQMKGQELGMKAEQNQMAAAQKWQDLKMQEARVAMEAEQMAYRKAQDEVKLQREMEEAEEKARKAEAEQIARLQSMKQDQEQHEAKMAQEAQKMQLEQERLRMEAAKASADNSREDERLAHDKERASKEDARSERESTESSKRESTAQKQTGDANKSFADALKTMAEAMNAPKQLIRDDKGKAVGVAPMTKASTRKKK
jgi:hypothetical protein